MIHVALYQPEIPPNAGNIIRLCANTGATLHFIHPLGFELEDKRLRRAGLDYHEFAQLRQHDNYDAFISERNQQAPESRIFAFTTKGQRRISDATFQSGDVLLFGPETRGLPADILDSLPAEQTVRIPMRPDSRSLNLSNAVAVAVYDVWRQLDFDGAV